jgi:murein DD-endopeptidase MepM/ murein hydrolase activator NlpD
MEPGFYPLNLEGTLPDGDQFFYSQWVYIADAGYPFDPVLIVDPSVVDPAVTEPENEQVRAIVETFTAQKQWQGQFNSPVQPEFSECFPSQFGNRRSYNGSPYDYFHSGLDFCGAVGDDIYAPAVGTVVFSGPLTVRGNTTIIDHGWGVFTIYMHQSEILVNPGDVVQIGQLIGRVGATGRVTGPHLHWEVWAGGVQVDPINWLQNSYP